MLATVKSMLNGAGIRTYLEPERVSQLKPTIFPIANFAFFSANRNVFFENFYDFRRAAKS